MSRLGTLAVDDAGDVLEKLQTIADATEAVVRARAVTTAAGVLDVVKRICAVLAAHDRTGLLAPFDDVLQGSRTS